MAMLWFLLRCRTLLSLSPMKNLLCKLLPLSNISIDKEASSKKRVFEYAGSLFETHQGIARAKVFDSLFARECLGSTGLGQGVAVPHGRIKGLKEAVAAFVRLSTPIAFESPDGQPVHLLIFLLVPEQATQQHLEILSELAQMLSNRHFRDALTYGKDSAALHHLIVEWEPALPAA